MNPYRSTTEVSITTVGHEQRPATSESPFAQRLMMGAFLYPLLLLGSFLMTWAVAWATLGNPPRPSLDDPKSINGLVDACYFMTGLLLIGFPAAVVGGVFLIVAAGVRRRLSGLVTASLLAAFAALWVGAIVLLRSDPWGITGWFMD